MPIITTILRQAHRLLAILARRCAKALHARIATILWRRRVLRELGQRKRD